MALSAEQKKKLERLGLTVLGAVAGILAESGGLVGKIAKIVGSILGIS